MHILGTVVRFIVTAIVLLITAWLVPGFQIGGFGPALLLALVVALLGWAIESMIHRDVTPFGRGAIGFLLSAVVIYVSQYIVGEMHVTLLGALLAAFIIGIFDLFVPIAGLGKRERVSDKH
ncbi:MAG: phage holin family protein [Gorillibacterium sp.]|nr:phage holin family protein [Gorillibacterium sp.]